MQAYRLKALAGALTVMMCLSACDAATPSQIHTGKIRVKEQMVTEALDAQLDLGRVKAIAHDFARNGNGEMVLTVPWFAGNRARQIAAEKQGRVFKSAFEKNGASPVSVATVPVFDKHHTQKVVVSYTALKALPPKDCRRLPGYLGGEDIKTTDQYRYGCDTQAFLSKMIADPSDLLGKDGGQEIDSRRGGATVEAYKAGTRNQPIQGMSASTVGN